MSSSFLSTYKIPKRNPGDCKEEGHPVKKVKKKFKKY